MRFWREVKSITAPARKSRVCPGRTRLFRAHPPLRALAQGPPQSPSEMRPTRTSFQALYISDGSRLALDLVSLNATDLAAAQAEAAALLHRVARSALVIILFQDDNAVSRCYLGGGFEKALWERLKSGAEVMP